MPWQVDGKFLRVNPDFSGPTVWSQDQQATIKVIATRHDYHDEDLAAGIQACLNINGLNTMLADLDMGNFDISNLAGIKSGNLPLEDGNLVIGTAGKGIDFDPAGSGADANLLDAYEEGEYTAILAGSTSGGFGLTVGQETLAYTRIGRQVFVSGTIEVASISSPVGGLILSLPSGLAVANLTDKAGDSTVSCEINFSLATIDNIRISLTGGQTNVFFSSAIPGGIPVLQPASIVDVFTTIVVNFSYITG